MRIYTIGHSTKTIEQLVEELQSFDIAHVVDVRSYPGSRYCPQFNYESLENSLPERGLRYRWVPGLGGRRQPDNHAEANNGWRASGFRGFADFTSNDQFIENLDKLVSLARKRRVAFFCSEAVPWRCHRRIISDWLVEMEVAVEHIMSIDTTIEHEHGLWNSPAPVADWSDGGTLKITYPKVAK